MWRAGTWRATGRGRPFDEAVGTAPRMLERRGDPARRDRRGGAVAQQGLQVHQHIVFNHDLAPPTLSAQKNAADVPAAQQGLSLWLQQRIKPTLRGEVGRWVSECD